MLTIFTIPKPFQGHIDIIQRNAIKSWTRLDPDVEVILFGDEEGVASAASELGVRHERHVIRNEFGTPLLDSVFDRAQEIARHPVVCYVNCDIVLLNDFCDAAIRVAAWRDQFLMAGRRWDADITEAIDFSQPDWREQLRDLALRTNRQRPPYWIDYFMFPRGQYYHKLPPFAVGRPGWDQWMIWYSRSTRIPVVDASRSVMAVHQDHSYAHHPLGFKGVMEGEEAKSNAQLLGDAQHLFTTEHAQYLLENGNPKWSYRRLRVEFEPMLWRVWFAILGVTRPLRHALGLRQKRVGETLPSHLDMQPRVSVIICTYNYGHFIRQCLESVARQTRPVDEVIVVDDGSADNTPEVVREFSGVRYLRQENAGKLRRLQPWICGFFRRSDLPLGR